MAIGNSKKKKKSNHRVLFVPVVRWRDMSQGKKEGKKDQHPTR